MKRLRVLIEAHSYASEELHDEYFDDVPGYAIAGPLVMAPLDKARDKEIEIFYDETTTLENIRRSIIEKIWNCDCSEQILDGVVSFTFIVGKERYEIENPNQNFCFIKDYYLDVDHTDRIQVCFLVSHDAGAVGPQDGPLRYHMYSREKGRHKAPHVHVYDVSHEYKATVMILTGEIVGKLPQKYEKMAKEEIVQNQKYYIECWNTLTDGLKVDINHSRGFITLNR